MTRGHSSPGNRLDLMIEHSNYRKLHRFSQGLEHLLFINVGLTRSLNYNLSFLSELLGLSGLERPWRTLYDVRPT